MHGLGIVGAAEREDLVFRHQPAAGGVRVADFEILVVELVVG
jgi:hypothetical protein